MKKLTKPYTARVAALCLASAAFTAAFAATCMAAANASAAITVRDDDGNVITLQKPALRVLSLAPHVTELLFAAGGGERIVGAVTFRLPKIFSPPHKRIASLTMLAPLSVYRGLSHTW